MNTRLTFALFFVFSLMFSQEENAGYKTYSYSELFKMIEEEQDTIFKLEDAIIELNPETDSRFLQYRKNGQFDSINKQTNQEIIVQKQLDFSNVQFKDYFIRDRLNNLSVTEGLVDITFKKQVSFTDTYNISLLRCTFNDRVFFPISESSAAKKNKNYYFNVFDNGAIELRENEFKNIVFLRTTLDVQNDAIRLRIINNKFSNQNSRLGVLISIYNIGFLRIDDNLFTTKGLNLILSEQITQLDFHNNSFINGIAGFQFYEIDEISFYDNTIETEAMVDIDITNSLSVFGVGQFKKSISSLRGYESFTRRTNNSNFTTVNHDSVFTLYKQEYKIKDEVSYNFEIEQRGIFYNYFKNKFNTKTANKYYVDIKNLETERIAYENSIDPSFKNFFTLKINQFLKVFSAYGTEPARAIIFSLYVIIFFALIYLFFPNSWDSHGKNRIMDRYRFFTKYMNREAGIHEVYLEEQKAELLESEDFKDYMLKAEKTIPKFFMVTAIPLYKWSVSGTKFSSSILKRIDIMKGSWQDLPSSKRVWKSILLVGAFLIAIIYDIFIKMLNALMLSINTFTTLGFGEIPIKGLPRYLAIIQGFIGWFMLTIFSVSLISQLLN